MSVRKTFVSLLYDEMALCNDLVIITGDLGYNILDNIRKDFPDRFYNVGAAEQLMLGVGVGMALDKKIPVCYSFTPFLLCRSYEWIRNYVDHDVIPVKLAGVGRSDEYDWLGFSHWATNDEKYMSGFDRIVKLWPKDAEEMKLQFHRIIHDPLPYYINLSR